MTDYTPLERGAPVPAPAVKPLPKSVASPAPPSAEPPVEPDVAASQVKAEEQASIAQSQVANGAVTILPESTLPVPHAPSSHPVPPDPTTFGLQPPITRTGESIYDYDMAVLKSTGQPWRRQGSDLSQWFNYGFDESSWTRYLSWRKGMVSGREAMKSVPSGSAMPDQIADSMHLARMPQDQVMDQSGPTQPTSRDNDQGADPNNTNNNSSNPMAMAMNMPMGDGSNMNMSDMFNQMGQMGMPMEAMMGMPMMQGMDFNQMTNMMQMFGGGQQAQNGNPMQMSAMTGSGTPGGQVPTDATKQDDVSGDPSNAMADQNQGPAEVNNVSVWFVALKQSWSLADSCFKRCRPTRT